MKRIAIVVPWYGDNISGGAEMESRELAWHLQSAGTDVEILTTCVKDFSSDWYADYFRPGVYDESGVSVRRFAVRKGNRKAFDAINLKLMQGRHITESEEKVFMDEMVNSPQLYDYIRENSGNYDFFLFIPYMFGTSFFGSMACPEKSIMIPCFHDEAYIYMSILKKVFEHCAGIVYNAESEKELANRVFCLDGIPQVVMGIGMDTDISGSPERFRKKYDIHDPFILYAGRKDAGKNVDLLIRYFEALHRTGAHKDLKLVLIGGGKVEIPESLNEKVLDLGFVDIQDKYDAYSAALLLCQPSVHESFSLVIMESWLCSRPVLVHEKCEVTKNFAVQSGGGLYFGNFAEFYECIDFMISNERLSDRMGCNGRRFVKSHFSWDVIIARYMRFFEEVSKTGL